MNPLSPALAAISLPAAIDTLAEFFGEPAPFPISDPFELVLYENVAYLAPDDRRLKAFRQLERTIGTRPEALLRACTASLEAVTSLGILKGTSAAKLRACAQLAQQEFAGDLSMVVKEPDDVAKKALRKFPGIGEPGAEKILLFAARRPFLAPESNGLRVLARLGIVQEQTSYARMYAEARLVAGSLGTEASDFQRAHRLLRLHGQTICKRSKPQCPSCPLRASCAYAQQMGIQG